MIIPEGNGFAELPGRAPGMGNPILPGYYADPSLLRFEGKFYLYATLDPWGGETLGCWESADFKNWTYRILNWPTKKACTSPESRPAKVWAPSVVQGRDGKFYMYVSVGSEVWVGGSDHPLGPWRNLLDNKPLISWGYKPGYHMIDAEAFIDDDGTAWLYWGSGHNWVNGKCWAVKLKPDMVTFDGEVRDVTPANYFEAPFLVKRNGHYFLMYSSGKTTQDTYKVHYATGVSPLGPFVEAGNSPILVTDKSNSVLSPGHHAVFQYEGKDYILYHRHSLPFDPKFIGRQTCVDELIFTTDGHIEKVKPTHEGPSLLRDREEGVKNLALGAKMSASSQANDFTAAQFATDNNYATRWAPAPDAKGAWLQMDLGEVRHVSSQKLRPEYAWKALPFVMEHSTDGEKWTEHADFSKQPEAGSPLVIKGEFNARYLRLFFPENAKGTDISLFEWGVW